MGRGRSEEDIVSYLWKLPTDRSMAAGILYKVSYVVQVDPKKKLKNMHMKKKTTNTFFFCRDR